MKVSVFVLERENCCAAEVHELDVLAAAVHQPERRFSQLIEYDAFLVVGDGIVDDDEVVELIKELRDAVSFVHEVADEVFELCEVFCLADVDEFHKMMLRNDAGHFEDVLERDEIVLEQRVGAAFQSIAGLKRCDGFSHVAAGNVDDAFQRVVFDLQLLLLANELQALDDFLLAERDEAEFGATRRDRVDDSRDVVADEAEASRASFFLHCSAKGGLCCVCHGIGFVEDDDLEGRTRFSVGANCAGF